MIDVRHLTDDQAQAFLEGALATAEFPGAEAHLASCADCQALVASFEALSEALSALPAAEPPPGFTAGVMARIEEAEMLRAAERRVTAVVFAALGVSLLVAIAIAGQSAWAPALSAVSSAAVRILQAFRISSDVLSPVVSALRIQIAVAAAAVGIPLFLALGRLASPRQSHQAA